MADPDPTYDAYLRALGFQQDTAQATAAKQTADINARAGLEIPELNYQTDLARQGVDADALGRGVWASGEHDRALAEAAHAGQYKLGSMEMTQAQSLGDVQLSLAQQLSQLAQQQAIAGARHDALLAAAGGGAPPAWGAPPKLLDPANIFG